MKLRPTSIILSVLNSKLNCDETGIKTPTSSQIFCCTALQKVSRTFHLY